MGLSVFRKQKLKAAAHRKILALQSKAANITDLSFSLMQAWSVRAVYTYTGFTESQLGDCEAGSEAIQ